jgi:hypothetical protein
MDMRAEVVLGGRYIINKPILSIQQNGDRRDLLMIPAETIVSVEAFPADEPLVTVSHNGVSCILFAQDLIERGALVGIRVTSEIFAKAAPSTRH